MNFEGRYARNKKTLSDEDQHKLANSSVAVIGCGGLGGYIAEQLARLGVGRLVIFDGDRFEVSNLNRQIMATELNIGQWKVEAAQERLRSVNSEVSVQAIRAWFEEEKAPEQLQKVDLICDALDSRESRVMLERVCHQMNIPLVYASIAGWFGQLGVSLPGDFSVQQLFGRGERGVEKTWGNPAFTPAAPIQNNQGFPIGVLDISGDASIQPEKILSIATMGANMIEKNLQIFELECQLKFYQEGFKLASSLVQQGFLAIDKDGIIAGINPLGAALLKRKQENIIGQPVGDIFSSPKAWKLNGHSLDLHLKESSGEEVSSHLSRVVNESGQALGAIGTLQVTNDTTSTDTLWIGHSLPTKRILERASKVAATHSSVLIHGESGTGKEIIAQTIHQLSPRHQGPFVALNCASLPASLVESELFGYVDGAFTGARRGGKPGKFELANKGTIFLDEIGDMPLNVQVALLRVLQEKEVSRIGDTKAVKIDVRVIAASHKNLSDLVAAERFRLDLFYRLKVVNLELPPLRERTEDIRDLVPHFIRKACESLGRPILGIQEEVYTQLFSNPWPGNVRELENCIESMVALAEGTVLTVADLPDELHKTVEKTEPLLNQQAKHTILYALTQTKGKIAPAAKLLGIGRNTLYRKIKDLDIKL